jgi:hypothetical protein
MWHILKRNELSRPTIFYSCEFKISKLAFQQLAILSISWLSVFIEISEGVIKNDYPTKILPARFFRNNLSTS